MSKVASTLFETGPDDKLVTGDAYSGPATTSTRTPIGYTPPKGLDDRGKVNTDTAQQSRDNSVDTRDVINAVNAGLLKRRTGNATRRASHAAGPPGAFTSLSDELKNEILFELSDGVLGQRGHITTTIAGTERQLDSARLDDAIGITRFLVQLTGDSGLAGTFDVAGELVVFNQVLKQAIDLGLVEVIDTLWDEAKDKEQAKQMLIGSLRYLAMASNLEGVRKVIGYIGRHEALNRVPDLIQYIMTFYRIPPGKGRADYDTLFNELLETLNLVEPRWDVYRRQGKDISSLEPFTYASRDALMLFGRVPKYRTVTLIAPAHRSGQLIALARRNYPHAGLMNAY